MKMLWRRFRPWTIMVNEALRAAAREVSDDGHDPAAQAGRALFRGLRGRQALRAPLHPHRDADGQHVVLQHDAQSAAAAHRPPLLRDRDGMGPAADELAV